MISQSAEYAIRAIVCLARRVDEPLTSQQLATATLVSPAYLRKILHGLSRADLVRARRGLGGGFVLALPPDQITIQAIISAIDPFWASANLSAGRIRPVKLFSFHRPLIEVMARVEQVFATTTVADLLPECISRGLCAVRASRSSTCSPRKKRVGKVTPHRRRGVRR